MISITEAADVKRFPNDGAFNRLNLQPGLRVTNGASGQRLLLTWAGATDVLLELMNTAELQPGAIALPSNFGASVSSKIILDEVELEDEEGAVSRLIAAYRPRNARETDEDVAAGLHRRTVSARWVERQEMIEHWAARKATAADPFNAALFTLWLQEADPAAKLDFSVTRGDGDVVALDNGTESGDWKGSVLTKAVAQRYAMGVQYGAQSMLQVDVQELWRKPPLMDATCNVRIGTSLPANHRPIFTTKRFDGVMNWIRNADLVEHQEGYRFTRRVIYLGVPNTMRPVPAPDLWGEGPIDEMLYPAESGEEGGRT